MNDQDKAAEIRFLKRLLTHADEIKEFVWERAARLRILGEVSGNDPDVAEIAAGKPEYKVASNALARLGVALPDTPPEVLKFKKTDFKP